MSDVLVDTSVWVDHFRRPGGLAELATLLTGDAVLTHPMVVAELACGAPPQRVHTLAHLSRLRPARQATMPELLGLIEREQLYGLGCGVVDVMLLASTRLTAGARLWTLDKRLAALAQRFGVSHR